MKSSQLKLITALILPLSAVAANYHDLVGQRNGVIEIDDTMKVDHEAEEIVLDEYGMHVFHCHRREDASLSFSNDDKYAACCEEDTHLSGAPGSFECCAEDHEVSGSKKTGYTCCPIGQVFDGNVCAKPKRCDNGKIMKDGECVCPPGTKEAPDGTCKKTNDDRDKGRCSSGIQEGMFLAVAVALFISTIK